MLTWPRSGRGSRLFNWLPVAPALKPAVLLHNLLGPELKFDVASIPDSHRGREFSANARIRCHMSLVAANSGRTSIKLSTN